LNSPDHDVIDRADRELLTEAYLLYRRVETQIKISLEERGSILPDGEALRRLGLLAVGRDGPQLAAQMQRTMQETRARFLRIVNRLKE
jgi:glutamine synthetase adenylyltransferase